ncbi:MAG: type I methionyl aminopeptidase [Planctomycetes bacterium]|nr:type I methionyl aminopeptidase [Planctomycetota bacterium]NOG52729.1 type I methionyl aminopeptidase [Planctomycetota bacterium]
MHMLITTQVDMDGAKTAAQIVVNIHQRLAEWLTAGVSLGRIDSFIAEHLNAAGAKSAFLGYRSGKHPRFPSHSCLSPNDVIVHGTAGMRTEPLGPGDVISIDIGVKFRGWIGDAAWTYIIESPKDDEMLRVCECGREALSRGIQQLKAGRAILRWAETVHHCIEQEYGYYCVRGLGGHGYGKMLHTPPYVSNVVPSYPGEWPDANAVLKPGMLLAVEPMVAAGTAKVEQEDRQWPIRTADGSLAVHYEHDVLITEDDDGPMVLTEGLNELPAVVGGS